MKTQPKAQLNAPGISQKILCDASYDDPKDPDPTWLRDLRDEICRALDCYYALGGVGLVGDLALAEHVNPPHAARGFDAERARRDLERCRIITLDPPDLFAPKPGKKKPVKPVKLQAQSLEGVELMAERTQTELRPEFVRTQARGTRQKLETRAKAGKKHNADLVVTMCLRWGFLGHLGAASPKEAPDFFGSLAKAEIIPAPAHEWNSLLGGLRCVKDKAPPPDKQTEAVAALRKASLADPKKALELLAPWFGTTYHASP